MESKNRKSRLVVKEIEDLAEKKQYFEAISLQSSIIEGYVKGFVKSVFIQKKDDPLAAKTKKNREQINKKLMEYLDRKNFKDFNYILVSKGFLTKNQFFDLEKFRKNRNVMVHSFMEKDLPEDFYIDTYKTGKKIIEFILDFSFFVLNECTKIKTKKHQKLKSTKLS